MIIPTGSLMWRTSRPHHALLQGGQRDGPHHLVGLRLHSTQCWLPCNSVQLLHACPRSAFRERPQVTWQQDMLARPLGTAQGCQLAKHVYHISEPWLGPTKASHSSMHCSGAHFYLVGKTEPADVRQQVTQARCGQRGQPQPGPKLVFDLLARENLRAATPDV